MKTQLLVTFQGDAGGIVKTQRARIGELIQPALFVRTEQVQQADESAEAFQIRQAKRSQPLIEGVARVGHYRQRAQECPRVRVRSKHQWGFVNMLGLPLGGFCVRTDFRRSIQDAMPRLVGNTQVAQRGGGEALFAEFVDIV